MFYRIFPSSMKRYVIEQLFLPPFSDYDAQFAFEDRVFPKSVWEQIDAEDKKHPSPKPGPIHRHARLRAENNVVDMFSSMLKIINSFRNTLAHDGSIAYFKSRDVLRIKYLRYFFDGGFTDKEFTEKQFGQGLLSILIILLLGLDRFDAFLLTQKLEDWQHENSPDEAQKKIFDNFIKSCGLPSNFIARIKNIRKELYTIYSIDLKPRGF